MFENCEYDNLDLTVLDVSTLQELKAHYIRLTAQADAQLEARGLGPTTYWLVDEDNDWEGETFGLAVPRSERADAAMAAWKASWEAYWSAVDRHADGLSWSSTYGEGREITEEYLEAFSAGSDNTYSSRVSYLSDEAVEKLLGAIESLPPGCTLSLYKGQLTREFPDSRPSEFIFDLWELSRAAAMNESAGEDEDYVDEDETSDGLDE